MVDKKALAKQKKLEEQYAEIVTQLQISFELPLENSSLAQPTPFKVLPTVLTFGAYEEPIAIG